MSWWNRSTCSKLALSVTEKTMRNPSPVLIYCSLIALNSSWPAVSSTMKMKGHKCVTWCGWDFLFLTFLFKTHPYDVLYVFHMDFEHTVGLLYNLVGLQFCHYVSYNIYRPPYIFNVHFSGCENCSIRHISKFYFILFCYCTTWFNKS